MYVSHELKVVYFGVPRTASRSVANFLKEHHHAHAVRAAQDRMGNHHGIEPKTLKACREFNYRIIATVRNPWDVIVSWWHHNQNWFGPTNSEFPRFVSRFPIDGRNNYMAEGRLYWRWTQHATHIIKYERLEADLSRVIRQPVSLPHIGESDRKPYQDYYDAELRAFVAEAFAPEIEEFKYTFQRRKR